MDYIDPYGQLPAPAPIASKVLQFNQGDTVELYRSVANPDGTPATPETCRLEFILKTRRFATEPVFLADWARNIVKGPGTSVQITIPSAETALFLRGSLLYSLVWYDILRDRTITVEEGNCLIEYGANAPNPDIPYKEGLTAQPDSDQTQGGVNG